MTRPRVRRSVNPVCRSLTSPGESRLDSPTSAKYQRCQKHSLTRRKTTALLDTHPERRLERFGPEIGQRRSSDPTGRASPRRRFRRHRGSFKMPLEDLPSCQRTAAAGSFEKNPDAADHCGRPYSAIVPRPSSQPIAFRFEWSRTVDACVKLSGNDRARTGNRLLAEPNFPQAIITRITPKLR